MLSCLYSVHCEILIKARRCRRRQGGLLRLRKWPRAKRRRLQQAFGIVEASSRTLEPWYSQKAMVGSIVLSVVERKEEAAPAFLSSKMHEASHKNGRPSYAFMHGSSQPTLVIVAIPASPCMRQNPTKNGMPQKI